MNKLKRITGSMMAGLLGAVLMMGLAYGQEGEELEEIVVTGS